MDPHQSGRIREATAATGSRRDIRVLEVSELDALLRAIPDDGLGTVEPPLYPTAALAGLRQGELIALRRRDVDWTTGVIRVRRSITSGKLGAPKSKRPSRAVPMADRVAAELERHFQRTAFQDADDLVFCHPHTEVHTTPQRYASASRALGMLRDFVTMCASKISGTFGTRMAADGAPLRFVQESPVRLQRVTCRLYALAPGVGGGHTMSLKARLGKAVQRRIAAMPSVQEGIARSKRIAPIHKAARHVAENELDDETAKARLSERLNADPAVIREATIDLSRRRDDYVDDRAYRLLSAAAAGSAVQPIPPEREDLFVAEEALGRLPLEEAFAQLAEAEPRLEDVRRQVSSKSAGAERFECAALPAEINKELVQLIGGAARKEDELLHTSLASRIVHQYLRLLAGDSREGPATVAYFDHPRKTVRDDWPFMGRAVAGQVRLDGVPHRFGLLPNSYHGAWRGLSARPPDLHRCAGSPR